MDVAKEGLDSLTRVWSYELAKVEGQSLSLGRVVVATALLVVGIFLSRRLSTFVGRRLLRRVKITDGARGVIEGLLFYFFLAFFTLSSLQLANVPLTVFAVIGGALAIGVGFGSQNVVNNFISGIILMIEQPVKVGDLVKVQDTVGNIERIGGRSTLIKTPNNAHIVLPNSILLDSAVHNMTLEDAVLREMVRVGITYGSDARLAEATLLKVAKDTPGVLHAPSPWVMFEDFGDNALILDLNYWVATPQPTEQKRIASRLRFAIWDAFKEEGLVFAFPQLDVHLPQPMPLAQEVERFDQKGGAA